MTLSIVPMGFDAVVLVIIGLGYHFLLLDAEDVAILVAFDGSHCKGFVKRPDLRKSLD